MIAHLNNVFTPSTSKDGLRVTSFATNTHRHLYANGVVRVEEPERAKICDTFKLFEIITIGLGKSDAMVITDYDTCLTKDALDKLEIAAKNHGASYSNNKIVESLEDELKSEDLEKIEDADDTALGVLYIKSDWWSKIGEMINRNLLFGYKGWDTILKNLIILSSPLPYVSNVCYSERREEKSLIESVVRGDIHNYASGAEVLVETTNLLVAITKIQNDQELNMNDQIKKSLDVLNLHGLTPFKVCLK
jgi:hypothetical protein